MYFTVLADVPAYTLFVSRSNVKCQMKWDRSVPGMRYGKEGVQEGGGRGVGEWVGVDVVDGVWMWWMWAWKSGCG